MVSYPVRLHQTTACTEQGSGAERTERVFTKRRELREQLIEELRIQRCTTRVTADRSDTLAASTSFRLSKLTETRESSLPPLDDWSPPPSPALSAAITLSTANLSGRLALSPAATEYKPSSNGSASGESKSSRSTVAQLVSLGNTSASSSYSRALSDTSDSSSASLARPFPRRSAPSSSQGGSVSSLPNHGFPPLPRQFLATPLAPAAPAFTPSSSFVPNSAPRPSHSTPSSFSEYLELIEKCKEEVKKYQALVVNSEKAAQTQLREKQVLQEQLKRAETEHQEQMKRKRLEMGQLWITIEALRKEKDSIQSGGVKDDNRRAELDQAIEERDAAITRASRLKSDLTHEHTSSLEERRHYQKALEVAQARRASAEDHNGVLSSLSPTPRRSLTNLPLLHYRTTSSSSRRVDS